MFLKATATERQKIRAVIYGTGSSLVIAQNDDLTWFVEIGEVIFEAESAAEALRELARILEEA